MNVQIVEDMSVLAAVVEETSSDVFATDDVFVAAQRLLAVLETAVAAAEIARPGIGRSASPDSLAGHSALVGRGSWPWSPSAAQ